MLEVGVFFLLAALVMWVQKVWSRYLALKVPELKATAPGRGASGAGGGVRGERPLQARTRYGVADRARHDALSSCLGAHDASRGARRGSQTSLVRFRPTSTVTSKLCRWASTLKRDETSGGICLQRLPDAVAQVSKRP